MTFKINLKKKAEDDLKQWRRSGATKSIKKIQTMLQELEEHPRTGTGRPELLSQDQAGLWSRRIDKKNRLIYSIHDDVVEVYVISLLGHYETN